MTANDILTNVRIETQESNPRQRWSNAQILPLISQGQQLIVREIMWPPSYYVFQTQMNVQRYQVMEILQTLQVYIAGQPIIRTDIETLEGDDIFYYDQTGTGGGPGGFFVPGNPPLLTGGGQPGTPGNPNMTPPTTGEPPQAGGTFAPQWTSMPPGTYPVASGLGTVTDTSCPWIPGMRPRYFFDGGVIGFVPAPAGQYTVVVRCIRQPADISEPTDQLTIPTIAKQALVWKTIELMTFANANQPGASDQRNYAMSMYKEELKALRKWKRGFDGRQTKGPNFLTYRNFYARGNNRNFGGCD